MERSVLQGLAVFRWGAWVWMAAVLTISRDDLVRPALGFALVGLGLGVTAGVTLLLRHRHELLLRPEAVLAELAVGSALVLCDGWAYGPDHAFSTTQSLGSVWPLAGVLAAAIALGPVAGGLAGVVIGIARTGATIVNGVPIDTSGRVLSLTNTVVFYALGGLAAGYVARLLRQAEREISAARARDEVARTLHDGVLQTLAVVERRTTDSELARLAREQERELRDYLFGTSRALGGGGDLGTALRKAATRWERAYGGLVSVVLADDLPPISARGVEALAGAIGESMANAGKHGGAGTVTVYVEPDGVTGVFCSVKDDGCGFHPSSTPEGVGLTRSVRERMAEVGGRVEVQSRPGEGAEVLLWMPTR